CILPRDLKRANIHRKDLFLQFQTECNGNAATACTDIDYRSGYLTQLQNTFDQMLCFRTGNQDSWPHHKISSVKLLPTGDVLSWFSVDPFIQPAAVMNPREFGQLLTRVSKKIRSILAESVRE